MTYSACEQSADAYLRSVSHSTEGSLLSAHVMGTEVEVSIPLYGDYNAMNYLAALLGLIVEGEELEALLSISPKIDAVPGRLEPVSVSGVRIYIDYCHTPDALEQCLRVLQPLTKGRLIVVFGCGGDRDKESGR